MLLSDVCLTSVAYIGPKSRTERPRKTKIGTEVVHVTRDSVTTLGVKRSKVKVTSPLWLAVQVNYIMYIDDTSLYATAHSEPLPVDHEYSCRKVRWAPQA